MSPRLTDLSTNLLFNAWTRRSLPNLSTNLQVLLIVLVIVADEHLVPGYLGGHGSVSDYKTKRHASRIVTVTTM